MVTAARAGRLFPPLDSAWSFGKGCYSPDAIERIADFAQMLHGFDEAHEVITKTLPVKMTRRQVWEQAERVGRDLVNRREDEE